MSDEHFSVDGTPIEAWASMKSFRRTTRLAKLLRVSLRGEGEYDFAMQRHFDRKPRKLTWIDGLRPTRDEVHDRSGLG